MDIGSPLEPRLLELLSLHKVGTLIKTQKENPEPKRCFPPQLTGDVDKIPPQKEESHLQHWLRFGEEGLWCWDRRRLSRIPCPQAVGSLSTATASHTA